MSNEKHFPKCLYNFASLWAICESLSFSLFLIVVYVLSYLLSFIWDLHTEFALSTNYQLIHFYVFMSHLYILCHILCQPIAIQIFFHIFLGLFVLLLMRLRVLIYYGYNIFSDKWFANIFSLSMDCLFTLFIVFCCKKNFKFSLSPNCQLVLWQPGNHCQIQCCKAFVLCFPPLLLKRLWFFFFQFGTLIRKRTMWIMLHYANQEYQILILIRVRTWDQ